MERALKVFYYYFVVSLVRVFSFCFCPVHTFGREHVPITGGFILAANHLSNLDPLLVPSFCPRRMRFLAKDSLFRNAVVGTSIRLGGGIPIRRNSADRGALSEALRELQNGFPLLMFPQGTRGGARVQSGVGFLAANAGVPVVPVLIEGTAAILPRGARFPRRGPVRITFGPPVWFSKDELYDGIAQKIMAAVNELRN